MGVVVSNIELAVPFTVIVDTREQQPYKFTGLRADAVQHGRPLIVPVERGTLRSGDYSIQGLESKIAIERKSAADLFGTLGKGRRRFVAELGRLADLDWAAVVVEGDWREILGLWPAELRQLLRFLEDYHLACLQKPTPPESLTSSLATWRRLLGEIIKGPPEFSQLNPKTIYRGILAWMQRYPNVHWMMCPNRRFAEITTFRILERYWKEAER